MWQLLVAVLILAVLAWWVSRLARRKREPEATFVCDECGEKDCICYKKEPR